MEERPQETTAGLTSASQLVNMTDAVSFEPSNTSSDIPESILVVFELPQSSERLFSGEIFKRTLRRSIRRESKILDILAKF